MAGLTNLGNTCYIASVLQGISASPVVVKRLSSSLPNLQRGSLSHAAADLLIQLGSQTGGNAVITPSAVIRFLREERRSLGFAQQDAEEAFLLIVGALFAEKHIHADAGLAAIADFCDTTPPITSMPIPASISAAGSIIISASLHEDFAGETESPEPRPCESPLQHPWEEAHPFRGLLTSSLQCATCGGHHEWKIDPFFDLSLTIPRPSSPGGFVTLDECLRAWSEPEVVDGALCDRCLLEGALGALENQRRQLAVLHLPAAKRRDLERGIADDLALLHAARPAVLAAPSLPEAVRKRCRAATQGLPAGRIVKLLRVARAPQVLSCHLKRVIPTISGFRKDRTGVQYPLVMSLDSVCRPPAAGGGGGGGGGRYRYNLVAVVEHLGDAHGGHYVCYARRPAAGPDGGAQWLLHNDARVRPAALTEVLNAEAYMLVYQRAPAAAST